MTLEVHGVSDADALGNNPIYQNGQLVGRATGGNYGFRLEKSLALAMVRPELAEPGTELEMDILGSQAPGDRDPRKPLRSGEPAPAQLSAPRLRTGSIGLIRKYSPSLDLSAIRAPGVPRPQMTSEYAICHDLSR